MKLRTLFASTVLGITASSGFAGTISLSAPFSDDASSGISSANTYTHAISGGSAVSVNGVAFDALTTDATPANFNWDTGDKSKNQVTGNFGDWNEANGRVPTGPEILGLLQDFTYSGNGADQPSAQNFTVSGLTSGASYDLRLYIRPWDTEGSGRPIAFTFTNGAEVDTVSGPEDRPNLVLGTDNWGEAYYLNYSYTAQSDSLVINAAVGEAIANSGSFHMYGLTNQVAAVPEPSSAMLIGLGFIGLVVRRRR
ncbi:MAG: PEP-CTERM sorting domain-containing protein [Verrucomicrobiales bacterium]|nr:PEP-CTERM sorting domain-containing protein [Verrucomicrobiae bacterium]